MLQGVRMFKKDLQYVKFCTYGFLKNLKFFEPFFILYLVEAGIPFVRIGLLFTIRAVSINLLEIPSGVIADSIGRRRAMILSFLSYIMSFLLFYFIPKFFGNHRGHDPLRLSATRFRTGTHKAMILDYLRRRGWEEYRTHYYGNTPKLVSEGLRLVRADCLRPWSSIQEAIVRSSCSTLIPYVIELALMLSLPRLSGRRESPGRMPAGSGLRPGGSSAGLFPEP